MKISHLVVAALSGAGAIASTVEGCGDSESTRHPCYQRAQCLNEPYPTNEAAQACGFQYNDPTCGNAFATYLGCKLGKAVCAPDGHVDQAKTNAACQNESNAYAVCKATDGGSDGGCIPRSCGQLGATCGNPNDGCGITLNCGACPPPQTCGAQTPFRCGTPGCAPLTCNPADGGPARCGTLSNGCGATLTCPTTCQAPTFCGGGGVPNQCGCSPSGAVGPMGPTSAASMPAPLGDAGVSQTSWSNPLAVQAVDNNVAQASLGPGQFTNYILAAGYGFAIPPTATIDGIQVNVTRASQSNIAITDYIVTLVKSATVATGAANRAAPGTWGTTMTNVTYGGSNDLWNLAWTPADVNSGGFGVAFAAKYTGSALNDLAKVDAIQMTVFYSGATCN
jgi:hypothetical protein